ncbi:hypothetical protein [Massilia rubra]|uniref:Uncharacterized protein n=1 Tax=Massilia rubra TaxID=2607910 RepID=A0ABX0LX61_9BURK|nr:hypothetical protein [Massilia rubra]NHZ37465.1 hypothetical protein [Massilia rubra]
MMTMLKALLLCLALALAACDVSPAASDAPAPAYVAGTVIDGFRIVVAIKDTHPLLNEHEKKVSVYRDKQLLASTTYPDPGGFASLYVHRHAGRIYIVDGLGNGMTIDTVAGTVRAGIDADGDALDRVRPDRGTFRFADHPANEYAWFPAMPDQQK